MQNTPMINSPETPACCSDLSQHWPFPQPLTGVVLTSCHFDPAQLLADDFARCDIAPVRGVAKRQTEYLAGRLCARQSLLSMTGTASVPAVGTDRAPQWPSDVCGSITHGQGWAGAITARRSEFRELGIDAEKLLPAQRAERLSAEILTPNELKQLIGLSDEQRAWRISLTFSLKESLFKALYPQVLTRFYFHDAELISADDCESGAARMRLLIDLSEQWPAGSELTGQFSLVAEHVLSLISIPA